LSKGKAGFHLEPFRNIQKGVLKGASIACPSDPPSPLFSIAPHKRWQMQNEGLQKRTHFASATSARKSPENATDRTCVAPSPFFFWIYIYICICADAPAPVLAPFSALPCCPRLCPMDAITAKTTPAALRLCQRCRHRRGLINSPV